MEIRKTTGRKGKWGQETRGVGGKPKVSKGVVITQGCTCPRCFVKQAHDRKSIIAQSDALTEKAVVSVSKK